jgi:hypothetical protein
MAGNLNYKFFRGTLDLDAFSKHGPFGSGKAKTKVDTLAAKRHFEKCHLMLCFVYQLPRQIDYYRTI